LPGGLLIEHSIMLLEHSVMPMMHSIPLMAQDPTAPDPDRLVRQRLRSHRTARGWSLDELGTRTQLSPSTISRIETGHRRITLDQLRPLATALGTTIDALVDVSSEDDADVVIRPVRSEHSGVSTWPLTRPDNSGPIVAKMRLEPTTDPVKLVVHPGRDWFYVMSGTVVLYLADRRIKVARGQAAEFSTMSPHAMRADRGPAELISIFDRDGRDAHLA
jgi:transcriptional regulator with XRE-family HTH domain